MIETPFKTPLNEAFAMSDRHAVQRLRAENERLRRALNACLEKIEGDLEREAIRAALGESNG